MIVKTGKFNGTLTSSRETRVLRVIVQLIGFGVACTWIVTSPKFWPAGAVAAPASVGTPVHLISYGDLSWRKLLVPQGGRAAFLAYPDQELIEWPAAAEIEPHVSGTSLDAIILEGTLEVRIEGRATRRLGPLSYFAVHPGINFAVRCSNVSPCVFYGFGFTADSSRVELTRSLAEGEEPEGYYMFADLGTATWSALRQNEGVQLGRFPWGESSQTGLLLNFNVFHLYRFAHGAEMPLERKRGASGGFVLKGTLLAVADDITAKELRPGSFFRIPGGVSYSATCKEKVCIVLATDSFGR